MRNKKTVWLWNDTDLIIDKWEIQEVWCDHWEKRLCKWYKVIDSCTNIELTITDIVEESNSNDWVEIKLIWDKGNTFWMWPYYLEPIWEQPERESTKWSKVITWEITKMHEYYSEVSKHRIIIKEKWDDKIFIDFSKLINVHRYWKRLQTSDPKTALTFWNSEQFEEII